MPAVASAICSRVIFEKKPRIFQIALPKPFAYGLFTRKGLSPLFGGGEEQWTPEYVPNYTAMSRQRSTDAYLNARSSGPFLSDRTQVWDWNAAR